MQLNEDFRFVSVTTGDAISDHDLKCEVSDEVGMLFDNVLATVVDYFEEAVVE